MIRPFNPRLGRDGDRDGRTVCRCRHESLCNQLVVVMVPLHPASPGALG